MNGADVWVAGAPGTAESTVWLNAGDGVAFAAPTSFNNVTLGFYDARNGMTAAVQSQSVTDTSL